MKTPNKINPNKLKSRDPLALALILGATKSGVRKDRRKDANRKACRKWKGEE